MDMDTGYNFSDLDLAHGELRGQAAAVVGPSNDGRRSAPNTRRGSLVPPAVGMGGGSRRSTRPHRERNLFSFGLKELVNGLLLRDGRSNVSYHEFAVFAPPADKPNSVPHSPSIMSDGEEGLRMFRDAVRHGHGLDNEGNFTAKPAGKRSLQGRVRQVIAHRRTPDRMTDPSGNAQEGLDLTIDDYEALGLHPATLSSLTRVTTESSFWDAKRDTLHIILSFSSNPQPPYDFLSMAYNLRTKTTTALIRRSFNARWHDEESLDEYEQRLDSCRGRWAHPLILPIVLLQVQLLRTEEAVIANNSEVLVLEGRVDSVTGTTGQANAEAFTRNRAKNQSRPYQLKPLKRLSSLKEYVEEKVGHGSREHNSTTAPSPAASLYDPEYVPPQTIHLMKDAHEILKGSIQLLDTLRWTERALKMLIQIGDDLEARHNDIRAEAAMKDGDNANDDDDDASDWSSDWHEIRQYLDCIWRLCTSLDTDRNMSQLRIKAQIAVIFSLMAQEDNNLNARMAVASTRDSSSMKALAVITAVFLPGEYISALFGMSMFNWQKGTAGDPAAGQDAAVGLPSPTIMPSFWIYWAFTVPLTLLILSIWRGWWVNQDRYFRRHLSNELSSERYWTVDGRPRHLETTFMQDFFSLFSLSGARSTTNGTVLGNKDRVMSMMKLDMDDTATPSPVSSAGPGMMKRGLYQSNTARDWMGSRDGTFGKQMGSRRVSFVPEPRQKLRVSPV